MSGSSGSLNIVRLGSNRVADLIGAEPGTWAAAALLAGGVGFVCWRRRKVS